LDENTVLKLFNNFLLFLDFTRQKIHEENANFDDIILIEDSQI